MSGATHGCYTAIACIIISVYFTLILFDTANYIFAFCLVLKTNHPTHNNYSYNYSLSTQRKGA